MKILICCANGMSSSLLVQKMREEVKQRGLEDIKIGACAKTQYLKYLDEADVLLIAPQLNFMSNELKQLTQQHNLKVINIEPSVYGKLDATAILDGILNDSRQSGKMDSESLVVHWLKKKVLPLANLISFNRPLMAISDAFASILPITIVGALLTLLENVPFEPYIDFITQSGLVDIYKLGIDMTTNILSVYLCFYIAYHYVKLYEEPGHPCAVLAMICFFMTTGVDNKHIDMNFLGSSGIFTAILVSILVGKLYVFIMKRDLYLKTPTSIPKQVVQALDVVVPYFVIITIFTILLDFVKMTPYDNFHEMIYTSIYDTLKTYMSSNIFSYIMISLITNCLWFLGLHGGNLTGSVTTAIYTSLQLENFSLYTSGQQPIHIISGAFTKCFISGGVGSMFSLSLMMVFMAKSQKFKTLGKLALPTTFFYINEPLLFGIPVVLNPLFLIPLLFITPTLAILTYIVMRAGIIPIPIGVTLPWTTPPVIYGILQGSWKIALWEVFSIVLAGTMWYPFFKLADAKELEAERKVCHN